ncbi:MAG TPA: TylF/MycF/NovP-related O-methyltransferase [Candidatus Didemnitutus sp.]|nr:TylF/MycF/NovP-related O-methyltransferase [Candidatus Didemnitutus sp.]
MNPTFVGIAKSFLFHTPLRKFFFTRYQHMFTAAQLCYICEQLGKTKDVPGLVVEVGCYVGASTLFLNSYMTALGFNKQYVAIDTFEGFTKEDVGYEVNDRKKPPSTISGFRANKQKWFDWTVKSHGHDRVVSVKADVNSYDFTQLGPISFALIDVDLYRPIIVSLHAVYKLLSPGGIIIVDDCWEEGNVFDGSYFAYLEFMKELGVEPEIVLGQLGIVRKPG